MKRETDTLDLEHARELHQLALAQVRHLKGEPTTPSVYYFPVRVPHLLHLHHFY